MSSTNPQLNENDLLGTWTLSAYEGRAEDGSVTHPFTDHPQGMLSYNIDGTMMVIITRPDRPRFAANDFSTGSDAEVRAAYEGCIAYCGRYSVDAAAGTVTHTPAQSLFPNWVGSQQVRFAALADGQLSLSTPPTPAGGKVWTFYLIWKRVELGGK